jgi:hypothetical protein
METCQGNVCHLGLIIFQCRYVKDLAYIKFSMYLQFSTVQNNILKNLLHTSCFRADIFWGAATAQSALWLVYWLDDWEILFRYPAWTRDFLFFRASILVLGPMSPAAERLHRAIFLEIWQRERAADVPPRPSSEVKNAAVSPLPPPHKPHSSGTQFHHCDCPPSYELRRNSACDYATLGSKPIEPPSRNMPPKVR